MDESGLVDWTLWIALALFAFTFLWCVIAFSLSRLSGWNRLAAAYPASPIMTPSARYRWQSALMNGNTKYNSALTVTADAQAVHFATFALLTPGHTPFSVPWEDVRGELRQLTFVQRVALRFEKEPDVTMLVPIVLAQRLAAASNGRFIAPS
jgi:hypothetical protein